MTIDYRIFEIRIADYFVAKNLRRWREQEIAQTPAYDQLAGYLKSKNKDCGYLLTFDFRKTRDNRFAESQWIDWEDKRIFDVVLRVGS